MNTRKLTEPEQAPESWQSLPEILHSIINAWPVEQREKFYNMNGDA